MVGAAWYVIGEQYQVGRQIPPTLWVKNVFFQK